MTETPNEPTPDRRNIDLGEVRKSIDSYDVAPAVPYDGEFKPLIGAYEPAPETPAPSSTPMGSAGDE